MPVVTACKSQDLGEQRPELDAICGAAATIMATKVAAYHDM
jgi:hypothetical protein